MGTGSSFPKGQGWHLWQHGEVEVPLSPCQGHGGDGETPMCGEAEPDPGLDLLGLLRGWRNGSP